MASAEDDFPRGGSFKKPKGVKPVREFVEKDNLFETQEPEKGKKRKKVKREVEKKPKKLKSNEEETLKLNASTTVEILHLKNVTVGTLVLGCVKEARDFELVVSLPSGLTGYIQITRISDAYTKILNEQVDAGESLEDTLALPLLFPPGMVLRCVVFSLEVTKRGHQSIKLSINPREVNKGLSAGSLKAGQLLSGIVASIEDHGYLVDIGVSGTKAFLPRQKAKEDLKLESNELKVGQYLNCLLEEVKNEGRIVRLSVSPSGIAQAVAKAEQGWTLSNLLPGLVVKAQVKQVTSHGLFLGFLSSFTGSVDFLHMDPERASSYSPGDALKACVLYILPSMRTVGFSLLPHLLQPGVAVAPVSCDSVGDVVQDCAVKTMQQQSGALLQLPGGTLAFAHRNYLKESYKSLDVNRTQPGTSHTCRVIDFSPLEQMPLVSLRKSVIDAPFLRYQDLQAGQLVEGTVISLHPYGMQVKVTEHIRGMVPRTHLADIILKNPEIKYSAGDQITCRVLYVISEQKKLVLTRKKTLLESILPRFCTYEDAKPGCVSHCHILAVKNFGCVVGFYGNIKGLVPIKELSTEPAIVPSDLFCLGQVVKAKVLRCDPEQEKLILSFKAVSEVGERTRPVQQGVKYEFETGKEVQLKINSKLDNGLDVSILPEGAAGFLPKAHLSDHVSNCSILWECLREGDIISNAVCLSKAKEHIILSKKPAVKTVLEEGAVAKTFAEVHTGMLLTGWIKSVMPYGVFVEFPYGLVGLAPKSAMSNKFVTNPADNFQVGQTVVARVTNLDEDKKRFLLNLKVSEVSFAGPSVEEQLAVCLQERSTAMNMMASRGDSELAENLSTLTIGQKLKMTVDEVRDDDSISFKSDQYAGATILATKHHLTGVTVSQGQKVTAVVLNVDFLTSHIHVSLLPKLVSKKRMALQRNAKVVATVQYIEQDFAVISLGESSQLTYILLAAHLNDTFHFESEKLSVGMDLIVTVAEPSSEQLGGLPLVVRGSEKLPFVSRERRESVSKEANPIRSQHSFALDEEVIGTVKSIKPTCVLLALDGGVTGSLHVSEIQENVTPGSFPTSTLKIGSTVTARVIGGKEAKSHKFLPITHPKFTYTIPELTLLSSNPTDEQSLKCMKTFEAGQEITCYVSKYNPMKKRLEVDVNLLLAGKVELLAMSLNPKEIKYPKRYFKEGQALKATVVGPNPSRKQLILTLTGMHSLTKGVLTLGVIVKVASNTGLTVSMPFARSGRVSVMDLTDSYRPKPLDKYSVGQVVRCCIIEDDDKKFQLSLRKSRTNPKASNVLKDPEILSVDDLKIGQTVRGYVKSVAPCGVFISLSRNITARARFKQVTNYFVSDHNMYVEHIPELSLLTTKILSVDKKNGHVEVSFLPEDTGKPDVIPESLGLPRRLKTEDKENRESVKRTRKRATSEIQQEVVAEKRKKENDSGVEAYFREEDEDEDAHAHPKTRGASVAPQRLQVTSGFSWDTALSTLRPATMGPEDDDSSEAEEEKECKKPQKTNKREKVEERQRAEKELLRVETELMDSGRRPQTANDFDRLLLSSPDSSLLWLQYMAFHLQATEIEQARAVAERALKTISFREEQEKLNVWVALLNLENLYGTVESLQKVFDRAVQYCEPLPVFQQLADIYAKSNKHKEAASLYASMLKRFRQERAVWLSYGTYLLKNGQKDEAQRLLQRALKSLPNKEHVDLIGKFAQLEFQNGSVERGKSMFESMLSNYPKRTDLWSVYIDLMIKHGSQKDIRNIFDRVIHLSLSAKRIKFFFKRYLDYEKKHGSDESVQAVKEKALEYVDAKGSAATQ
ncbi:protein RRP5 homolog [Amia ocellicauda]|uniref:protein RRP5 homolog n=1 Tax=Amia ocellicauda TaxID=2972642 RepID=UPI003464055C